MQSVRLHYQWLVLPWLVLGSAWQSKKTTRDEFRLTCTQNNFHTPEANEICRGRCRWEPVQAGGQETSERATKAGRYVGKYVSERASEQVNVVGQVGTWVSTQASERVSE